MKRNLMTMISAAFVGFTSSAWAGVTKDSPPADRITEQKAQSIALKQSAGNVEAHELEFEGGKWVYSFDIRGTDKLIHEVQVDAQTGKVVSNKTETSAQEEAEAAAETKTK